MLEAIKRQLPQHKHSNMDWAFLHCTGLECMFYAAYYTPKWERMAIPDAPTLEFNYLGMPQSEQPATENE